MVPSPPHPTYKLFAASKASPDVKLGHGDANDEGLSGAPEAEKRKIGPDGCDFASTFPSESIAISFGADRDANSAFAPDEAPTFVSRSAPNSLTRRSFVGERNSKPFAGELSPLVSCETV